MTVEKWETCLHVTGVDLIKDFLAQIPSSEGARDGIVKLLNIIAEGTLEAQDELRFLELLRQEGVDNWDGYEYAKEALREEKEMENEDD